MLCIWSAKGGVGCSTIASAVALLAIKDKRASSHDEVLLVDLGGDLPAVLGVDSPSLGIADWLAEPLAAPDALRRIEVPVTPGVQLLPLGSLGRLNAENSDRYRLLFKLLVSEDRLVVVDVGLRSPEIDQRASGVALLRAQASIHATDSVLVTRLCFLGLRSLAEFETPNRVIVVAEPGRALSGKDVSRAVGAPVQATVRWDPAVARVVDAGLIVKSVPRGLRVVQSLFRNDHR